MQTKQSNSIYLRPWWWRIIAGPKFTFEAPFTVKDCVHKLKFMSERDTTGYWFVSRRKLFVRVERIDADTYTYYMHRAVGSNLDAVVSGTLQRQGESTLVSGRGSIGLVTWILIGISVNIWLSIIAAMILSPSDTPIYVLFFPLFFVLMTLELHQSTLDGANIMIREIHKKLGKRREKSK